MTKIILQFFRHGVQRLIYARVPALHMFLNGANSKLLWRAYRNSPTLFRMVPSPTPQASLPRYWGFATQLPPLISGTGNATDFKFGGYIYRANPYKSPLKNLGENGARSYPGTAHFFGYPSQEWVKPRTSNFVVQEHSWGRSEQKPMKNVWNSIAVGVVRESRKFSGHPYIGLQGALRGHLCDSTAQLSCL